MAGLKMCDLWRNGESFSVWHLTVTAASPCLGLNLQKLLGDFVMFA